MRGDAALLAIERQIVEKREDPGWKVPAHHVSIAREAGPAGNEGCEKCGARIGGGEPAEHLLHVEKADIVFPALADDDFGLPLLRVFNKAGGFLVQLALQVLGVG